MTRAMKDSGIEWIGQIPENWKISKLFYQLDAVGSGTTPQGEEYYDGNIPWLNTGDLTDENVEYAKKNNKFKSNERLFNIKVISQRFYCYCYVWSNNRKIGNSENTNDY